ncbi:MAG: hypothetical protein PHT33_08855, partial [bacterium]|nr:hypothetical protein [bacterium]
MKKSLINSILKAVLYIFTALLLFSARGSADGLPSVNETYTLAPNAENNQAEVKPNSQVYRFNVSLPNGVNLDKPHPDQDGWVYAHDHWKYKIDKWELYRPGSGPIDITNGYYGGDSLGTFYAEGPAEGNSFLGSIRWSTGTDQSYYTIIVHGRRRPYGEGGSGFYEENWNSQWKPPAPRLYLYFDGSERGSEDNPGAFIPVNSTQEDNNLVKVRINWVADSSTGTVTVTAQNPGNYRIRLWNEGKTQTLSLPYTVNTSQLPQNIWVEGIQSSESLRDTTLTATWSGDSSCHDTAKLTIFDVQVNSYSKWLAPNQQEEGQWVNKVEYSVVPTSFTADSVYMTVKDKNDSEVAERSGLTTSGDDITYSWDACQGGSNGTGEPLTVGGNPYKLTLTAQKNQREAKAIRTVDQQPNEEMDMYVVKVDLKTIRFTSDHQETGSQLNLIYLNDPNNATFADGGSRRTSSDVEQFAEWVTSGVYPTLPAGRNDPITQTKGTSLVLNMKLCIIPTGLNFRVKGLNAQGSVTFEATGTSTGVDQEVAMTETTALPNMVTAL